MLNCILKKDKNKFKKTNTIKKKKKKCAFLAFYLCAYQKFPFLKIERGILENYLRYKEGKGT